MIVRKEHKKLDQRGIVSLLICMIMIVVIGLIAVGFTELSDNEQKSALNSQLNEAAYYAADSGINYARSIILQDAKSGNPILTQDNCEPGSVPNSDPYILSSGSGSNTLSSPDSVSYPCLTVDPSPYSLSYDISVGQARPIPINITGESGNSSLTFQWDEKGSGGTSYSSCPSTIPYTFPGALATGCDASVLKIDITTSSNLLSASQVIYLYPTCTKSGSNCVSSTPTDSLPNSSPASVFGVPCGTNSKCSFKLTSLPGASFYIRVMPIYGSETSLILNADNDTSATTLTGAQAIVRSTGRAQNVLQSLSAAIDISGLSPETPSFALQSQNTICASLDGYPGFTNVGDTKDCSSQLGVN